MQKHPFFKVLVCDPSGDPVSCLVSSTKEMRATYVTLLSPNNLRS